MGRIIFSLVGATLGGFAYSIIYILYAEKIQADQAFQIAVSCMSVAIAFAFILPAISHQSIHKSSTIARMGAAVFFPILSATIYGVAAYLTFTEYEKLRLIAMIGAGAIFWLGLLVMAVISMFSKDRGHDDKL